MAGTMSENRIDELLDARADGTLDAAGHAELIRLLEQDPSARLRARELDDLRRVLDEAAGDEPPAALAPGVMQRISALPARRPVARVYRWSPRSVSGGGMVMAKKVMFGVAAAAADVLISVAITGYPHVSSNETLGAIGAAKRAQAPQIAASDVQTGDPAVQQFLQSETFDRLIKDPGTKKLLSDPSFRSALASANIQSALASSDLRMALANSDLRMALSSAEMRVALADANIQAAFAKADFRADLAKADLKAAFAVADLKSALAESALSAAFAKNDIRAAFASAEFQAALARSDFQAALSNAAFRAALADSNLQAALHSDALMAAMHSPAFASALQSSSFAAAFRF
jgi:hypothetical protein